MSGMRFQTSQQMRLGQSMRLAPRVIQSMEILQLALPALEERVERELESNIALETCEPEQDAEAEGGGDTVDPEPNAERELDVGAGSNEGDFARLDAMESSYEEAFDNEYSAARMTRSEPDATPMYSSARHAGERDAKMDAMANTAAPGPSLVKQLADQWTFVDVDENIHAAGLMILEHLDADGYLRTGLATIADQAPEGNSIVEGEARGSTVKPTVETLETALAVMQRSLEPAGVAARDVRECLLLQLDAIQLQDQAVNGDSGRMDGGHARVAMNGELAQNAIIETVRILIRDSLDDLSHNRLPKIVEKTGLPMERLREAMSWMQRLSLAPARQLVEETAPFIVPDAIVEYDEQADRYIALLTDGRIPPLRISPAYSAMARDRAVEKPTREFIRTNLSNAQWLIEALQQRRQTLLRVLNVVLVAQRDFFDFGPSAMKPLPMTQVADQLGIHVATVSRAVAGKHIQTPRGVFPLRKFFTGGMQTDAGEDVSWDAIRAALRDIVDGENKSEPLSDDAIVEELKKRGVDIARRTVAKYRAQLDIPSARLRKRH